MPVISICTPCFNECENVAACYEAVRTVFEKQLPGYEREHIFADNCSTDGTVQVLRGIAARDKSVKLILNARNFGIVRSSFNGIISASGDAVFMFVPADLQDPPELFPKFVALWEKGYEVVYGVKESRDEGLAMRFMRGAYYAVLRRLANIDLPMNLSDFQLLDRKVIIAMRQFDDFYPFVRGLPFQCTANTIGVPYRWRSRARGISKNRMAQLIDQGLTGITATTQVPTRLALFAGLLIACGSLLYAIVNLAVNLIAPQAGVPPGISTLIAGMFFFNGLLLLFIGILGEHILVIDRQVRRSPRVVERERVNFGDGE